MQSDNTTVITVLYDGHCGMCRRSVATLRKLDWLGKLSYLDFHNEEKRKEIAPHLQFEDLDKAMHIIFRVRDRVRVRKGFYAFRSIAWRLPLTFLIAPTLYIPGIPWIGTKIYAHIAGRRKRCTHENCTL